MKRAVFWSVVAVALAAAPFAHAQTQQFGAKKEMVLYAAIPVSDIAKARDFYTKVVGLKPIAQPAAAKETGSTPMNFTGAFDDSFIQLQQTPSGKNTVPAASGPIPRWVFKVSDTAALVQRATANGGSVTRPAATSGMGNQVAFIRDPDGNDLEILQVSDKSPPLGAKPTMFFYTAIPVSDVAKSTDFYTKLLGLKPAVPPGGRSEGATFNFTGMLDETFVMLQPRTTPPAKNTVAFAMPPAPRWVFKVADTAAVVQRVKAAGYPVTREPQKSGFGSVVAFVRDPDGHDIELMQGAETAR